MNLPGFKVATERHNGFRARRQRENLIANGPKVILDDAVVVRLAEEKTDSSMPNVVRRERLRRTGC